MIGCDTVVVLDGNILEKPRSRAMQGIVGLGERRDRDGDSDGEGGGRG